MNSLSPMQRRWLSVGGQERCHYAVTNCNTAEITSSFLYMCKKSADHILVYELPFVYMSENSQISCRLQSPTAHDDIFI